jgi:hypothetical protein
MIEDMQARLLNPATQRGNIRGCKRFVPRPLGLGGTA